MRPQVMFLIGILLLYCSIAFFASAAAQQTPVRVLLQEGEWAARAGRNLSSWRSHLFKLTEQFIVSKGNDDHPKEWDRFEIFQPFIRCPPDRPLRRVGPTGDGGKWLCEPASLKSPCVIISIGSNMDFRFEEAVLSETPCKVVTLDCTCEGRTLPERHAFYKKCVGSPKAAHQDPSIVTYGQFVSSIGLDVVPILKIDVETFEYTVFAEWHEHTPSLPEQIAVEVHWHQGRVASPDLDLQPQWGRTDFGVLDLSLFFFHMANLGYGIVNQEINEFCPSCSEFTLFRVEAPPRTSHAGRA